MLIFLYNNRSKKKNLLLWLRISPITEQIPVFRDSSLDLESKKKRRRLWIQKEPCNSVILDIKGVCPSHFLCLFVLNLRPHRVFKPLFLFRSF